MANVVDIRFGPLDVKSDGKAPVQGAVALSIANNVDYSTVGSISKRNGYVGKRFVGPLQNTAATGAWTDVGQLSHFGDSPTFIRSFRGSLLACIGRSIFSFVEDGYPWQYRGEISPSAPYENFADIDDLAIETVAGTNLKSYPSAVCDDSFVFEAWRNSSGALRCICRSMSGEVINGSDSNGTPVASITTVSAVAVGNGVFVAAVSSSAGVHCYVFDAKKRSWRSQQISGNASAQVVMTHYNGYLYFFYVNSACTRYYYRYCPVSSLSVGSEEYNDATLEPDSMKIVVHDRVWMSAVGSTYFVWSSDSALNPTIWGVYTGASYVLAGYDVEHNAVVGLDASGVPCYSLSAGLSFSGMTALTGWTAKVGFVDAFYDGRNLYVSMPLSEGVDVFEARRGQWVGRFDNAVAGYHLYAWDGRLIVAATKTSSIKSVTGTLTEVKSPYYYTEGSAHPMTCEVGGCLFVTGSAPSIYNGREAFDASIPACKATFVASSGSGSITGTYSYCAVFAYTDQNGVVWRGTPSDITQLIITSKNVDITVSGSSTHQLRGSLVAEIYRTDSLGSILYLAHVIPAGTYTLTDSATGSLAGNQSIYTTGNVLANDAIKPCSLCTSRGGRAFISGIPNEPNSIYYSKTCTSYSQVAFSDYFRIDVDHKGGPITAIAAMDDKLVVFKEYAIFVIQGAGPNDAGVGYFSDPELVTVAVGCKNPHSVTESPDGLVFQSDKGVYLLSRGLDVVFIGAAIETIDTSGIVSGVTGAKDNRVYLTTDKNTYVYDFIVKAWSVYTRLGGVSSCVHEDDHIILRADKFIYTNTRGVWADGGSPYALKIRTHWVSAESLASWNRVQRIVVNGDRLGDHDLRIKVGYDFSPAMIESWTFCACANDYGESTPYGSESPYGGEYSPYSWQIQPGYQQCSAFRIDIEENIESPYSQSCRFSGLSVKMIPKGKLRPIGSGRSL